MPKAFVAYMTGTGNTWRAARRIADTLTSRGWTADFVEIRKGEKSLRGDFAGDLFILCFPVYAFGMPVLVRSVLGRLRGKGKPAGVFATWGGAASASLWQANGFLRRRGFQVLVTRGASYPFNWTQMLAPTDPATSRQMTTDGDKDAQRFALDITGSPERHGRQKTSFAWLLFGLPTWWLYTVIGRFGLGAILAADERCNACGECARDCPAGAIHMAGRGDARRPRWGARCQGCNRCVNLCPKAAIQSSLLRAGIHVTVNLALIVAAVIGLNRLAALAALPRGVSVVAWIVVFAASFIYLTRLQAVALEPALFGLESMPALRKLVGGSWTARFGRNSAEGFRPRQSEKAPRTQRTRRS